MANKYFRALAPIITLLLLNVTVVVAQGPLPDLRLLPRPLMGAMVGLLILGAGYAVKKIHDHSKK